jgi:hypothetical protein
MKAAFYDEKEGGLEDILGTSSRATFLRQLQNQV